MDEFSLIDLITGSLRAHRGAHGGVGDDAAILDVPAGQQLVVTTDTLVEGVHFEPGAAPADIGYKSLAVNLSDLAAMGSKPAWFFLALTHPSLDKAWVQAFAGGLDEAATPAGIALAGGDTARGPLSITITALGLVPLSGALLRSGARPGDIIGLSGSTGRAALALRERQAGRVPAQSCMNALNRPVARLALGQALRGLASSCIDVSDGLLADLGHIASASGVGARLELKDLPSASELAVLDPEDRWNLQLAGGDDYELCFTMPVDHWDAICARARESGISVSMIGEIVAGSGCECLDPDGNVFVPHRAGYNHGSQE